MKRIVSPILVTLIITDHLEYRNSSRVHEKKEEQKGQTLIIKPKINKNLRLWQLLTASVNRFGTI